MKLVEQNFVQIQGFIFLTVYSIKETFKFFLCDKIFILISLNVTKSYLIVFVIEVVCI